MARKYPMASTRDELWAGITKLQDDIFENHTISSKYFRIENGVIRYLQFPEPDDLFWPEAGAQVESFSQAAALLDPSETDRDLHSGIQMLIYFVNLTK